ncbi:MAG: hypothetical protein ACAH17_01820, partial [Candidatus Paceibacterota bacterium]
SQYASTVQMTSTGSFQNIALPANRGNDQKDSSSKSSKKVKPKKGDDGLVTWDERMIELATGTEHHHYQVLRTLPEHIPYFRLNPEGFGSYPLDSTSIKVLNEICVKTREWCQLPDVATDLDRISDILFAKGFYLSGPHVLEARVETDCKYFICSRTPLGIPKDLRFHIQMVLLRPLFGQPITVEAKSASSLKSNSISCSVLEGLDDPANSLQESRGADIFEQELQFSSSSKTMRMSKKRK